MADEGQMPDDHIQFELEFILHVLSDPTIQENDQIYKMFLEKHLLQWGFKHCERIEQHSQNTITYAIAVLLKEILQLERNDDKRWGCNMLTENFSRRTFLKGSAALSTLLGLGTIGNKATKGLIPTAQAETNRQKATIL